MRVSVIVPVRNEQAHIAACLDALLAQQPPPGDDYELLVIDGVSTDRTREIVGEFISRDARIRLLDNPQRTAPCALNIGIDAARGDVIIRVDGHATVAPDFVAQNLALLAEHPDAWVVGGPIVHRGRTVFARGAAAAMSSRIGVGGASHRFAAHEGEAESCAFPTCPRHVFHEHGLRYDEQLVRNQDDEFCLRVCQAGGRIIISPRVKYDYFVRETPRQLWRQYAQYGFWKVAVMRKHRRVAALRHLVPAAFVAGLPVCVALGVLLPWPWGMVALSPLLLYALMLIVFALGVLWRERHVGVALCAPLAATILHLAYGSGTLLGLLRARAPQSMTQLSR
ncbi:MAG: glycosyltransferase family 2 protein [Planctomycetota bacterium]